MSKILIVTAHPDDAEFGMGATLHQLMNGKDYVELHIFSQSDTIHGNEGIQDECKRSISDIYKLDLHLHKYPTMHFHEHQQAIRNDIFKLKQDLNPDIIYCKSPTAIHPDHIVIGDACESIFLEKTVYGLEGVRDGQNQVINKWNKISEEDLNVKMQALMCYKTQNIRAYSDAKVIEAWARWRGSQVGVEYAEGFEVIREVT